MLIREEKEKDYPEIYELVRAAFGSAEHADGNEQDLVTALRKGAAYIPALSLVAEAEGRIVGHVLFMKAEVQGHPVLALAPLSVLPEYQRRGVGTALIAAGHRIAGQLGYDYAIVLGSNAYYSRHGYVPADEYGIRPPFEVPKENFMACKLREGAPRITGVVRYAKEFGLD